VTMPGANGRAEGRAGRRTVVDADGRAKAYRPVAAPERTAAVIAGLEAYASGDFFEAHELMEPAWMGTDDQVERDLIQGLIKLAAADVHGVRGNPRGVARNLEGARDRLRRVPDGGAISKIQVDLPGLLDAIDRRLAALAANRPTAPITIDWSTR
jgi:predicted metal-dependent hydrolase